MPDEKQPTSLDDALRAAVSQEADAVLQATGGDIYGPGQRRMEQHGEPVEAAPEPTSETKEEAAPETEQGPAPTADKPKLIAGKYVSVEEAEKGIIEAGNTISDLRRRLDAYEAARAAPEPVKTEEPPDPLDEVAQYGVPKEPLRAAMNAAAQAALNQMFAPMQARAQADAKIISEIPEYKTEFDNLTTWLKENPEVEKQIVLAESLARNPDEFYIARKYAWMHYDNARKATQEVTTVAKAVERATDVATKRVDAAVSDKKRTDTRDTPAKKDEDDWDVEKQEKLKELARAGHTGPLWKATIGTTLAKQYPALFGPDVT